MPVNCAQNTIKIIYHKKADAVDDLLVNTPT
jgi:hypothetical protein